MNLRTKQSSAFLAFCTFAVVNTFLVAVSIPVMPYWITAILLIPAVLLLLLLWPDSLNYRSNALVTVLCMYIVIFSIWPQFSAYKVPGLPAIEPQRLVYGFLLLQWAILLCVNRTVRKLCKDRLRFATIPVICLTTLFVMHFLAAIFNENSALPIFFAFRELVALTLILAVTLTTIRSDSDIQRVFFYLSTSAGAVAILAIIESFLKHNLFASWVPLSSSYAEWATAERIREGVYRVQATFDNPLLLVDFLLLLWPIAFHMSSSKGKIWTKLFCGMISLLIPLALLRTQSRVALFVMALQVMLFIALLAFNALKTKKGSGFAYLVCAFLIVMVLFAPFLLTQLKTVAVGRSPEEVMSSRARMEMITRAANTISKGDLYGYGFGRAPSVVGIKTGPPGKWIYVLDNYFITLLLDSGVIALASYCILCLWLFYKSLFAAIRYADETGRVAGTLFLSISGFVTVKLISSQTQVFPIFYILVAALITSLHIKSKELNEKP